MFLQAIRKTILSRRHAQAAFEYIILLTTVVIVVLLSFHPTSGVLVRAKNLTDEFMNTVIRKTYGRNAVGSDGVPAGQFGPFP